MPRASYSGFLLVLEGIDGAGKSTLGKKLATYCGSRGLACTMSREPTDGPHGRALRESAVRGRLPLDEELELFLKDRAEHVNEVIVPALARGEIVILDRYYFSNAAYQGARGADPAEIVARNEEFAPAPDLVLLLDLDAPDGRQRILRRGDQPDDFEAINYLAKVRAIFLALPHPAIRRIDGARPAELVLEESTALLEAALLETGILPQV
ncbi:MAG TPA: dTMP kinase [Chthoniobacteraceae bacterium]|jgi:dTMP kinase